MGKIIPPRRHVPSWLTLDLLKLLKLPQKDTVAFKHAGSLYFRFIMRYYIEIK